MIKRINNNSNAQKSNVRVIRGTVLAVNERGLKLKDDSQNEFWLNFSKYLTEKPEIKENDAVVLTASGDFINKIIAVEKPQPEEPAEENADNLLLDALRSAVKIASTIESEVSIKFSTQDIIKLALTLFIQKSANL